MGNSFTVLYIKQARDVFGNIAGFKLTSHTRLFGCLRLEWGQQKHCLHTCGAGMPDPDLYSAIVKLVSLIQLNELRL